MPTKYKQKFPPKHGPDDFECFGPAAQIDADFDDAMLADMGCFKQPDEATGDTVDSNKYYHGAVVKSRKDGLWYAYFEYGRVGNTPAFIFHEGGSKDGAHKIFQKQMLSKNVRRGVWSKVAGKQTLVPKPVKDGSKTKDLYLVRPTAKRSTGLPDAKKIIDDDSDGAKKKKAAKATGKKSTKKKKAAKARFDTKTMSLGRDLTGGTVQYTKATLAGGFIPQQVAIEEGRDILAEATRRVGKLKGAKAEDQAKDRELRTLTQTLYSRIPKTKERGAKPEDWILNAGNIQAWQFDLDAFESALLAIDVGDDDTVIDDPFDGMNLELVWMDPSSLEGQFVQEWMPKATANRHGHVGGMKILNMWALRQPDLFPRFTRKASSIADDRVLRGREKPRFQPQSRKDLSATDRKTYSGANTAMLFHGTRSVNVTGILRTGLKLPRQLVGVAITGAMFGPGVYWADDWKKSDGYTSRRGAYYSGGGSVKGRGAFMFVADVALGNPHIADSWGGFTKAPSGCHSVAGLARRGFLANNEWIVYDPAQNNLRYLVEYDVGSRY